MSELVDFHHELAEHDLYLGRPDIIQNVVWKKVGHTDFIASKNAVEEYDAALAEYNTAMEHATSAGPSENTESNTTEIEIPQLEVAELTLVAKISPSDFWLTPCAFWKGPTSFTPTFADIKLNCRLIAPVEAPFDKDFAVVLENVKSLLGTGATEGHKAQGIFDAKEKPQKSLKVRHVVFEPKNNEEKDDDDAFKLCDWPVKSDAARTALADMIKNETHRVHPLPAYNVDGELIAPAQYTRFLAGAIVRATISIKRWSISSDKRDTYVADIERFRVVVPAPVQVQPGPSTPRKRKMLDKRDDGASPSKKAHTKVE